MPGPVDNEPRSPMQGACLRYRSPRQEAYLRSMTDRNRQTGGVFKNYYEPEPPNEGANRNRQLKRHA